MLVGDLRLKSLSVPQQYGCPGMPAIRKWLECHPGFDASPTTPESPGMRPSSPRELARFIDHTLLKADATGRDIEKLCAEALQAGFASVCVNGSRVMFV